MTLKPAIKEQWLAALRSGTYQQGRKHLREDDNFCCLGVLCDLAVKEGVIPEPIEHPHRPGVHLYGQAEECGVPGCTECLPGSVGVLPREVLAWSGMPTELGYLDSEVSGWNGDADSLAQLNDSGKTFAEIADVIEAEF